MSMSAEGRNGMVIVRLSSIDRDLRMKVADEIIDRGKLSGFAAAELKLAAWSPVEDPILRVTKEKADRVLRERKQPLGEGIKVWTW